MQLYLARLAGAALRVGRSLQAGDDLEVCFVLAGGVALGIAAAGLGAVTEGKVSVGHNGLLCLFGRWRKTGPLRVSCCSLGGRSPVLQRVPVQVSRFHELLDLVGVSDAGNAGDVLRGPVPGGIDN